MDCVCLILRFQISHFPSLIYGHEQHHYHAHHELISNLLAEASTSLCFNLDSASSLNSTRIGFILSHQLQICGDGSEGNVRGLCSISKSFALPILCQTFSTAFSASPYLKPHFSISNYLEFTSSLFLATLDSLSLLFLNYSDLWDC